MNDLTPVNDYLNTSDAINTHSGWFYKIKDQSGKTKGYMLGTTQPISSNTTVNHPKAFSDSINKKMTKITTLLVSENLIEKSESPEAREWILKQKNFLMDLEIQKKAIENNKTIEPLETPEDLKGFREIFLNTVCSVPSEEDNERVLLSNVVAQYPYTLNENTVERVARCVGPFKFSRERNQSLVNKIDERLKNEGKLMVALDIFNIVGEGGVNVLLKERGWVVEASQKDVYAW